MSDAVIVAAVTTGGLVAVALIQARANARLGRRIGGVEQSLGGVEEKTEAVREQVQNSHRTNFRDDHDDLRRIVERGFESVKERQDRQGSLITGVKRDVTSLTKRFEAHIDGTTSD
jgi:hypothetical protein